MASLPFAWIIKPISDRKGSKIDIVFNEIVPCQECVYSGTVVKRKDGGLNILCHRNEEWHNGEWFCPAGTKKKDT